jgi:hypothetical protein
VKSYIRFPVRVRRRKPLNDLTWRDALKICHTLQALFVELPAPL